MKKDLYSIKDLVNSIIDEYQLPTEGKGTWSAYRQEISRILKNSGIWNRGIAKNKGKKTIMHFTEQQRQELLSEKTFYNYLRDRSKSEEIRNSKRYDEIQKAIEERRISHIEYLTSMETGNIDKNAPVITDKEFRDYKRDLMITALFERFFTPIDDKLLLSDLYHVQIIEDELDLQVQDIEAEHRLSHPEGYYYTKKKNGTD